MAKSEAEILSETAGVDIETATRILDAKRALDAAVPVGVVMRNSVDGSTAIRVLNGRGVPVWSIVSPDNPQSYTHEPPDLPAGSWIEFKELEK